MAHQPNRPPYPTNQSSTTAAPYPTMPYPGFANYGIQNHSSDSLGQRIQDKEQRYRQFGNPGPVNPQLKPHGGQPVRIGSMASVDSGYPVQPAPAIGSGQVYDERKRSFGTQVNMYAQNPQNQQNLQNQYIETQNPYSQRNNSNVDSLGDRLSSKLSIEEKAPLSNIEKFNELKDISVNDYNSNEKFDPKIQLDWVIMLLEYTNDLDFLQNYNINGEKLSKVLNPQEVKKNEHVFIKQAIKLLKKITIETKYPDAEFLLGSLYSNSPIINVGRPNILDKNYEKSFDCYQKAANQGHALALYRLAVSYEIGVGTSINETKALDCFIKSANLDCVPSMFKLGVIYSRGALKTVRSAKNSLFWFEKASLLASKESPHSLYELAKIYERDLPFLKMAIPPSSQDYDYLKELDSLGYHKDDARALHYYKEAVRFKHAPAQFKLGWCYEYGKITCPIDAKKSIGWYSRSASQGYPAAEMGLSGWYLTGAKGILEPNDKEAFLWASKAAESGFAKAEYALGYYYEVGLGVQKDMELSRKYYIRAATQGHDKAIARLRSFQK